MSSQEWITIIGAIGLVLVNIITAWRTDTKVKLLQDNQDYNAARVDDKAEEVKQATQETASRVDEKLGQIHELTNSRLTSVQSDLALANDRVAKLEELTARLMVQLSVQGANQPSAAAVPDPGDIPR